MNKKILLFLVILLIVGCRAREVAKPLVEESVDVEESKATISEVQGNVEIYFNGKWSKALEDQNLSLNDKIKTGENSTAALILHESIFVEIDPLTEIEISSLSNDNTILKQDRGTTWNKFTDVAGISSYSVQTPTTIASVRGTEFEISSDEEASVLMVEEGEVDFKADNEEVRVKPNEKFMVKRKKLKDRMAKKMEKLEMGLKDHERMAKRVEKNVKRMEKVKERVIRRSNLEEGKVKELFEKTKKGEISREEFEKRTKLKPNTVKKVFEMDKKVNREVERVKQIKTIKEEVKKNIEVRKDLIENNIEDRRLRYDEAKIRRRVE